MKRIGAAITISAAAFTASCGGAGTTAAAHHVVTGQLLRIGGPAPGLPVPLPGQIEARDANGNLFSATAGRDGRFRLLLPLGTYRFTGRSPRIQDGQMLCAAPKPVHVTSDIAGVLVVCSIR